MDIADDIAYGVHDLEDVIKLKLVTDDDFRGAIGEAVCSPFLDSLKLRYPHESANNVYDVFVEGLFSAGGRKRQISRLVHYFMTKVEFHEETDFGEPIVGTRVRLDARSRAFLDALKLFVSDRVIKSPSVQHLEFKGQQMVLGVFEALAADPSALLPASATRQCKDGRDVRRTVCDHIAGMTDHHLLKTYERLFSPRMGSVFDIL